MTSYRSCADVHGNVVTCTRMYQICTELSNDQTQITVTIKRSSMPSRQNQGQILDDQNLDPGSKQLDALILGDPLVFPRLLWWFTISWTMLFNGR